MNTRIPETPPKIEPVKDNANRPKWSVMIPTFNCLKYLQETLEAVLAQGFDEKEMQIEVIDDCSTDGDYAAVVSKIGKGRVGFYRQEINRGSLRNFETCINRARGEYVHILHGDDKICPGYYKEIDTLFKKYPDAGAAFTDFIFIDEQSKELYRKDILAVETGVIDNWLDIIAQTNRVQPPAIVVKRSVYEHLGSFYGMHYGEDWEMWVRISVNYPVVYSPVFLAQYRVHTSNISSRSYLDGQNIRDINKVISLIKNHLPAKDKKRLTKLARYNFATYFAKNADLVYLELNNRKAAKKQVKGALEMSFNWITFYAFIKTYFKSFLGYDPSKKVLRRARKYEAKQQQQVRTA